MPRRTVDDLNDTTSEDAFAPGGEPRTSAPDAAEAPEADAAPLDAADEAESLRAELEAQQDRYLRLAAEFDNFRRRTQRERAEAGARAQGELVKSLLEELDDLQRVSELDAGTATASTVIEGVVLVQRKLLKELTAAGLVIIDPLGEPFDPNRHEAISTAPAASAEEDDTVGQVYQLGYLFGSQLLRPARVVVKQWHG